MPLMRRHNMWSTAWEMVLVDKLIEGHLPEDQIFLLGVYQATAEERADVARHQVDEYIADLMEGALADYRPTSAH